MVGEYEFSYTPTEVGVLQLEARATDIAGNLKESSSVTVSVTSGIAPSVAIDPALDGTTVARGNQLVVYMTASDLDGVISRVELYNGSQSLGTAVLYATDSYRVIYNANQPGQLFLTARATDDRGNISSSALSTVTVKSPHPLTSNRDFVVDIYSKFLARIPTDSESSAALGLLNNTLISRAQWLDSFISPLSLNAVATTINLIATNNNLIATNNNLIANNNNQIATNNQIDSTSASDTTINQINTNINQINTNISLIDVNNNQINANTNQIEPNTTKNQINPDTTNYDIIYMIYRTMLGRAPSFNEFIAAEGATASALVSSLVSAYQGLFGTFPTSVGVADQSAIPMITQLFANKHGEAASLFNQSRLRIVLTGDTYLGNTVNFVAAFAADNLLSEYQHPSGPLSNDMSYVVPNDATVSIPAALTRLEEDIEAENTRLQELIEAENARLEAENARLQGEITRLREENTTLETEIEEEVVKENTRLQGEITRLLEENAIFEKESALALASNVLLRLEDSNDIESAVSDYQGLTVAQALELILADARYYNQFSQLYTEGYVTNRMAQLGIFDLDKNSAFADCDNDNQSNLYELALGSNPTNASDTVPALSLTQEGAGFVVRYIQINPATVPSDLVIRVDSSLNLIEWSAADANIASDQSGVPALI